MSIHKAKKLYRYSVDDVIYDSRPKLVVQDHFKHLRMNRKKEQMQEDYYTEVERENRILLEKIRKIMKSNKHSYIPSNKEFLTPRQPRALKKPEVPKSLMVKDSVLNFSDVLRTPNTGKSTSFEDGLLYYNQSQSVAVDRPRRLSPLVVDIKEMVFQKNVQIDGRFFSVEIIKGRKIYKVTASDAKTFTTYSIEIDKKDAIQFMGGREDWDMLVRMLHFEGTELSLYSEHYNDY